MPRRARRIPVTSVRIAVAASSPVRPRAFAAERNEDSGGGRVPDDLRVDVVDATDVFRGEDLLGVSRRRHDAVPDEHETVTERAREREIVGRDDDRDLPLAMELPKQ